MSTDGSGNNTLNAGVIKSNTGSNTGLTIASDGQVTVNQNNPTLTLGANTTFPAGQILHTQYDSYSSQTTIGDTNTNILSATFNTKGANSRILVLTNLLYGSMDDAHGFHGGITMTTGSSASTDYNGDAIQLGATPGTQYRLFGDDIGAGRHGTYGISVWYANASKVTSYAKNTQITIALWVNGDNTMYINRSHARANTSEMNISTLVAFEIAT